MLSELSIPSEMSVNDLRSLVKTGEGTYLEFKRTLSSARKIVREIAAFANTNGGNLLVGVDDDKSLIGVSGYHEEEFVLHQAAYEMCRPAVPIQIEIIHFLADRDIMLVRVPEMEEKPIYVKKGKKKRVVYVREKDKSVVATDQQVAILSKETSKNGVTFEYGPNEQKLFRYLKEYHKITVKDFSDLIDVTSYRASSILVNLVSAGILELYSNDSKEYYSFSADCS